MILYNHQRYLVSFLTEGITSMMSVIKKEYLENKRTIFVQSEMFAMHPHTIIV